MSSQIRSIGATAGELPWGIRHHDVAPTPRSVIPVHPPRADGCSGALPHPAGATAPRSTRSGLRLSAENPEEQGRGLAPGLIACGGSVNRCQQRQGTPVELVARCRQAPGRSCAMLRTLGRLPEVGGGGFHGMSLPAVCRFQNVAMGYSLHSTYTWKGPRIGKHDPSMSGAMWQELPWSCQKVKSPRKLRWARQEPPTHQMTNASAGSAAGVQRYISMGKAGCRASTR